MVPTVSRQNCSFGTAFYQLSIFVLNSYTKPKKLTKFQAFILGIFISHIGEPASREEAPIIAMAPHSTIIDGFFLPYHGMITGNLPRPVAKSDVRDIPLIGALVDICDPIYVTRERRKSRSDVVHAMQKNVNLEQPYPQVSIFPEGTCSNAQSLLAFKLGAFISRGKNFASCCH